MQSRVSQRDQNQRDQNEPDDSSHVEQPILDNSPDQHTEDVLEDESSKTLEQ